ncbi:hypothetical protein BVY04_05220 [bacterium M21]|nr:hypothetical protein BVY04_05220 [bacterium M21]
MIRRYNSNSLRVLYYDRIYIDIDEEIMEEIDLTVEIEGEDDVPTFEEPSPPDSQEIELIEVDDSIAEESDAMP